MKKILLYALGGGLGHITRANALVDMFPQFQFRVIHSAAFPKWISIQANTYIVHTKKEILSILHFQLSDFKPDEIWVDVFPQGIFHELSSVLACLSSIKKIWIARLLNLYTYPLEAVVYFNEIWVLEELQAEFQMKLDSWHIPTQNIILNYPVTLKQKLPQKGTLIAHSGSIMEFERLIQESKTLYPTLPIFSQTIHHQTFILPDFYPASAWFDSAEAIFTGAGFHSIVQLKDYRAKHIALPFQRKFDLQEYRFLHNYLNR